MRSWSAAVSWFSKSISGGILDKVLVKSELELVTLEVVAAKRNQVGAQAKQAMVDLDEGGLTGLIINEQVVDLAQLLPLGIESGGVEQILDVPLVGHVRIPF